MSHESRLAFLMNFEIADAILDISAATGWDLVRTTRRVYATDTYRKWRDIPTDYCKYAYPVKLAAMCDELHIPNAYHLI